MPDNGRQAQVPEVYRQISPYLSFLTSNPAAYSVIIFLSDVKLLHLPPIAQDLHAAAMKH